MASKFNQYLKAGYPAIWIETHEEFRAIATLAFESNGYSVFSWDVVTGQRDHATDKYIKEIPETPIKEIGRILQMKPGSVVFLKDFPKFFNNIEVLRSVKNLISEIKADDRHIIFISPAVNIPIELEKDVTVLPFTLPTVEELVKVAEKMVKDNRSLDSLKIKVDKKTIAVGKGLTLQEAENAMARSIVEKKEFSREILEEEKLQCIKKSGMMELFEAMPENELVMEGLKQYIHKRIKGFDPDANLPTPKGILLVGVPGGGKSLAAKVVSSILGCPLVRLDIGALKGSKVGESEARMRQALAQIDALGFVVVWMDEIEKVLTGVQSSGQSDAGTTSTMFGTLLTWMQESKSPHYLVATCLAGNTLLQLQNGELKEIKNFEEGNILGLNKTVFGKIVKQGVKTIIKINTNALSLECTKEHKIFIIDSSSGEIVIKEASHLHPGDLMISTLQLLEGDNSGRKINPIEYNNDSRCKSANIPEVLSDDLAYILGFLCGDGGRIKNHNSKSVNRIHWVEETLELTEQISNKFKKVFNVLPHTHKRKNVKSYYSYVDRVSIGRFIECNFPEVIISGSKNRKIPESIQKLDNKGVASFLAGLFDAESYVQKTRITIAMTSEEVIKKAVLLLKRFNIQSCYSTNQPKQINRQKVYKLTISDNESLYNFSHFIKLHHPKKNIVFKRKISSKLRGYRDVPKLREFVSDLLRKESVPLHILPNFLNNYGNNMITRTQANIYLSILENIIQDKNSLDHLRNIWSLKFITVKEILETNKDEMVYDIVTNDENHAFLANDLLVHNCNDIEDLLAISQGALLRRFDDIFFVDLPNEKEREEIIKIMNKRYNTKLNGNLASRTQGWTGAEIEKYVMASIYDGEEEAFTNVHPISEQNKGIIEKAREWALNNARIANSRETVVKAEGRKIRV
jgi:SpoVK/Ycf46/Vps4 family AAA+-type ATPase